MNMVTLAPIVGMLIALISVLICLNSKTSEVQKWLTGATVSVFLYFLGNYFFVIGTSLNDFYQTHKLIYLSTMMLGVCFCYALAELCEVKLSKILRCGIAVVVGICAVAAMTLDKHNFWYVGVSMAERSDYPGYYDFAVENGWLFYVVNVVTLTSLVIYTVFLMLKFFRKKGKKNSAIKVILIVVTTPPLMLLLSESGILATAISNHAMIIGVNLAIIILQIRHDIMTTVPVAKERAIESTTDGIIILNIHEEVLFTNQIIHKIFPEVEWDNPEAASEFITAELIDKKKYVHENGSEYEVRKEEILDGDRKRGYILWVINITEQMLRIREEEKNRKTKETLMQAITALATSIDAKDKYTQGHSLRVAKYSRMLAERLGKKGEELDDIYNIAMLHDVGKIGIPDEIISKPSSLTDEEFNVIKSHPVKGYEILSKITSFPELATGARWHHEKYNGQGYSDGLTGKDIPEVARIITIADAYDAMASTRSYRAAMSQKDIRQEMEKNKGIQFDPEMADVWIQIMDEDVDYLLRE